MKRLKICNARERLKVRLPFPSFENCTFDKAQDASALSSTHCDHFLNMLCKIVLTVPWRSCAGYPPLLRLIPANERRRNAPHRLNPDYAADTDELPRAPARRIGCFQDDPHAP